MHTRPCPFCSSEELAIEGGPEGWAVECGECFARGPTGPTEDIAYELWDRQSKPH